MEITFREAIRMVHPDSNKGITDAGDKVRTIMSYKNDPQKMYLCLRKWGLVPNENGETKKQRRFERVPLQYLRPVCKYDGTHTFVVHRNRPGVQYGVLGTTRKRVYFTQATVERTGKKWCDIGSVAYAYFIREVI